MANELFLIPVEITKDPESRYAICCNPNGRFHAWLFKLGKDDKWVSMHRLSPIDLAKLDDRLFGEDPPCT